MWQPRRNNALTLPTDYHGIRLSTPCPSRHSTSHYGTKMDIRHRVITSGQLPSAPTSCWRHTITCQYFQPWSSLNHFLTHVSLIRVACGSNISVHAFTSKEREVIIHIWPRHQAYLGTGYFKHQAPHAAVFLIIFRACPMRTHIQTGDMSPKWHDATRSDLIVGPAPSYSPGSSKVCSLAQKHNQFTHVNKSEST